MSSLLSPKAASIPQNPRDGAEPAGSHRNQEPRREIAKAANNSAKDTLELPSPETPELPRRGS